MNLRTSVFVFAVMPATLLHCTQEPVAPVSTFDTKGLARDTLGLWVDTLTMEPFADMPRAFREVNRYCFDCHSSRGQSAMADSARAALTIDTWQDLVGFGPERFLVAAKIGAMPPDSTPPLPRNVLSEAEAFLVSWNTAPVTGKP